MPMDRDEFHIKQMDPNELENRMARNKRKTTPIISRLDQTNKNNTSGQKKTNTGQEKYAQRIPQYAERLKRSKLSIKEKHVLKDIKTKLKTFQKTKLKNNTNTKKTEFKKNKNE